MLPSTKELAPSTTNNQMLLAYMADLELEVDRLRKQGRFIQHEAWGTLKRIDDSARTQHLGGNTLPRCPILTILFRSWKQWLRDVQEPPGYHPAHDQVIAIAVRRWPSR